MGHKYLIAIFILSNFLFANSYPDIDLLVERVKLQREGLSQEKIKKLKNPFISENKIKKIIKLHKINYKIKKRKNILRLIAIFNDRAKINYRWYKIGDKVGHYKLVKINPYQQYVLLKHKKRFIKLFHKKRKYRKIKLITVPGRKK